MINSIKMILVGAASLLVLVTVFLGILVVSDVYTMDQFKEVFVKTSYILGILTLGSALIAFVFNAANK